MNKVDLWTCGFTIHTRVACGVMWHTWHLHVGLRLDNHVLIYLNYWSEGNYHLKDSVAFGLAEFDDD